MIEAVQALSGNELSVVLRDGTEHRISMSRLSGRGQPSATFRESRAGRVIAGEKSWGSSRGRPSG